MTLITDNIWFILAVVMAGAIGAIGVYNWDRRAAPASEFKLHDIVKLDSGGWRLLMWVGVAGAIAMIGSSIMIGIDYWVGLAIDADTIDPDTGVGKIDPNFASDWHGSIAWLNNFWHVLTAGVISFFVIAIIMEIFADLGAPWSAALERKKNPILSRLVVAGFVMAILMSLATKWGYYDDKRDFREREAAQLNVQSIDWETKRNEAQAIIDDIGVIPTPDEIEARRTAAEAKRRSLEDSIADARESRDRVRGTHSTNLVRYQETIDEAQHDLNAVFDELALLAALPSAAARLEQAKADRQTATDAIKASAGVLTTDGREKIRTGDLLWIRGLRVVTHQFLCFLFPMLALYSRTAWKEEKRKEDGQAKRAQTMADQANTFDVTPKPVIDDPLELEVGDEYYDERAEREAAALAKAAGLVNGVAPEDEAVDDPERAADAGA